MKLVALRLLLFTVTLSVAGEKMASVSDGVRVYVPFGTLMNEKLPLAPVVVVCTGLVLMETVTPVRLALPQPTLALIDPPTV